MKSVFSLSFLLSSSSLVFNVYVIVRPVMNRSNIASLLREVFAVSSSSLILALNTNRNAIIPIMQSNPTLAACFLDSDPKKIKA